MNIKTLFLELVKIPSPSGQEGVVREFVQDFLAQNNIQSEIVKGNLVARVPGSNLKIMLVAHLDTVQKVGEIVNPVVTDDIIKSDGKTILGADNKAGVAILLKVAEEIITIEKHPDIYLVFTANEEAGRMTALDLPLKEMKIDLVLNVDGGKPPGTIDVEALGQEVFEIEVLGKAAHAATEPEKGKNALIAAINIVNMLKIGKETKGDTLNIGKLLCDGATNVVPNKAIIKGEVRSFTNSGIQKALVNIKKSCVIASKLGVEINFKVLEGVGVPVWEKAKINKWKEIISKAALKCGLKFKEEKMFACSDANALAKSGVPTFSINRGGKNPHSHEELITTEEMEDTIQFIKVILEQV